MRFWAQKPVFELPNPRDGPGVPRRGVFFPPEMRFGAQKPVPGPKKVEKKVEIEGAGPPQRDPQRNSAPGGGHQVKNGGMATHLVTNLGDLGSVGVPAPARTPWEGGGWG